jgi:hypothetical protein
MVLRYRRQEGSGSGGDEEEEGEEGEDGENEDGDAGKVLLGQIIDALEIFLR